jgi:hypothetical protein
MFLNLCIKQAANLQLSGLGKWLAHYLLVPSTSIPIKQISCPQVWENVVLRGDQCSCKLMFLSQFSFLWSWHLGGRFNSKCIHFAPLQQLFILA